jgi:hypothetical protein
MWIRCSEGSKNASHRKSSGGLTALAAGVAKMRLSL